MSFAAFSPLFAQLWQIFSSVPSVSWERKSKVGKMSHFPWLPAEKANMNPALSRFFLLLFFGGKLIFWTWSIWTGNSILVILFSVCFLYKIHIFGILIAGGESSQSRGTSLLSFLPFGGVKWFWWPVDSRNGSYPYFSSLPLLPAL